MMSGWRYRLNILSRILAGFGGGYVLTSLIVTFASLCLPGNKASAVLMATMPGFLIYAMVIMAVFHTRNLLKAWIWIAGGSGSLAMAVLLFANRGAGG
ncbi:hypothetical protein [Sphingobium sp. WCS2017Hpa-17]|uniref:hypothetical protein n=1 Tax=Sphingobium sp. WCS2017Hpa-17 TaxID=3073638 RepID=UPI00288C3AD7|nr:hypothetical protein [Sphingobium sp. WCS2017Hpa-17]